MSAAAEMVRFRPGRVVQVKLTELAPAGRFNSATFFGPSPREAMETILDRIMRGPEEVEAHASGAEVDLRTRPGPLGAGVLLAAIWSGLTLSDVNAALAALHREGWQPLAHATPLLSEAAE